MTSIDTLREVELVRGFKARFVHTENFTLSFVTVEAGSILPDHSHPNEQVSQVIEGQFEMQVGDEKFILNPGNIIVIPSNVHHSGKAITPCKIQDTFYPVREDYKRL
ncbi:MAG: hypothetical protein RLZZ546_2543 [Bacteroidota bacterium]